jgi:hypothetical protein
MMMDNEPRMQDRSPEGQMFAIESEIKNMMKDYEVAVRSGDNQRAQMIADAIDRMQKKKIELQGGIADMAMRKQMAKGDEAKKENGFPDLSGDGKITRKDILMGQGVEFAEGGEADMQMSEQQAMAELEGIAPEAKMIEQLVMAVMQMIQQGVSEADVRAFLTEQGLDDEDIEDLFMIVMQQIQQGPTEEPIGQELQGMM